ncbi:hypothetical protein [Dermatobacter hominis]|uniref:hypothetical protein n=1 Tax=Dermatobacter hominis TaxID=2884263 RepID=UPI001D119503|nr:hypothetical protein [Dermatobacter hominis]UDY37421.1 hypothetical protein LH044_07730 [Dermatobacter hominis]
MTVVIDFQDLGGGIWVRCAPGPSATGFEALQRAGVPFTTTVRFPGFLCRIDGRPAADPCQTTSPASAYWSYWIAPRGGAWCYSSLGGANRNPPEGSVEGWSFSLGRGTDAIPPPRFAPPARVPGAPASLPGGECDAAKTPPTVPPSTTPTAPPTTARPAAPRNPTASGGATGPAGTAPAAGAGPGAAASPAAGGPDATAPAGVAGETTVPAAPDGGTATTSGVEDADDGGSTGSTIVTPDGEEVAINAPGSSGDGPSSSPVGVLVALVLIAALSATSFVVRRRTRATT